MSSLLTATIRAFALCVTPLVFKNARLKLTIVSPRQRMVRRGSCVTTATAVACRFSLRARRTKVSTSSFARTTAMRSWDSDIASSVPSSPSYFFVTLSKSTSKPSASSPMATHTPPAPKSLQRLISVDTALSRNRRCIFLSVGGFPFCTSAPQVSMDCCVCALEEPVAPPQPSRPVAPPKRTITSPGCGTARTTFSFGEAPITAPISILFAA